MVKIELLTSTWLVYSGLTAILGFPSGRVSWILGIRKKASWALQAYGNTPPGLLKMV
jgi:hypothetical protein